MGPDDTQIKCKLDRKVDGWIQLIRLPSPGRLLRVVDTTMREQCRIYLDDSEAAALGRELTEGAKLEWDGRLFT